MKLLLGILICLCVTWEYLDFHKPLTKDQIAFINQNWNHQSNELTRGAPSYKVFLSSTGSIISSPELQDIVTAVLVGLTIWLIKQFLQNFFQSKIDITYGTLMKARLDLDEHMKECNKIPKDLIIEKIDNLSEKLDIYVKVFEVFQTDVKKELAYQRNIRLDRNI